MKKSISVADVSCTILIIIGILMMVVFINETINYKNKIILEKNTLCYVDFNNGINDMCFKHVINYESYVILDCINLGKVKTSNYIMICGDN